MFGRLANSAEQRSSEAGVMAWKLPALVLPSPDHVHVQTMSGNSKYHNSMHCDFELLGNDAQKPNRVYVFVRFKV